MSCRRAIVGWVMLALASGSAAQSLAVRAEAAPDLAFGQPFALLVDIGWRAELGAVPELPPAAFAPLQVELLRTDRVELGAGAERFTRQYRARALASGTVVVGPLELRDAAGRLLARSEPCSLPVRSTLAKPPGTLEWPGDVREPAVGSARWWWLLPVALLVTWFVRPRRARVAEPASAVRVDRLAELEAIDLPGAGDDATPFHLAVKTLLRCVAAERHAVASDVATSEELLVRVPAHPALRACLQACDAVLFAADRPVLATMLATRASAAAWLSANEGAP